MKKDGKQQLKIWIDLDNSPHVPFFRPIINELKHRGCEVVITSRDCFETTKLLKYIANFSLLIKKQRQSKLKLK